MLKAFYYHRGPKLGDEEAKVYGVGELRNDMDKMVEVLPLRNTSPT